jgi:hypothetical protein
MLNPHVEPIEHAGGPSPHAPTQVDELWTPTELAARDSIMGLYGIADAPTDLERRRYREEQ